MRLLLQVIAFDLSEDASGEDSRVDERAQLDLYPWLLRTKQRQEHEELRITTLCVEFPPLPVIPAVILRPRGNEFDTLR